MRLWSTVKTVSTGQRAEMFFRVFRKRQILYSSEMLTVINLLLQVSLPESNLRTSVSKESPSLVLMEVTGDVLATSTDLVGAIKAIPLPSLSSLLKCSSLCSFNLPFNASKRL